MDQAGNVVGVVVAKLNALKMAAITDDIPQNVNFAIKSHVAIGFLEANGIAFSRSPSTAPLLPPDLAGRAKQFTVHVECRS